MLHLYLNSKENEVVCINHVHYEKLHPHGEAGALVLVVVVLFHIVVEDEETGSHHHCVEEVLTYHQVKDYLKVKDCHNHEGEHEHYQGPHGQQLCAVEPFLQPPEDMLLESHPLEEPITHPFILMLVKYLLKFLILLHDYYIEHALPLENLEQYDEHLHSDEGRDQKHVEYLVPVVGGLEALGLLLLYGEEVKVPV